MNPSTAEISVDVREYVLDLYEQLFSSVPIVMVGLIFLACGSVAISLYCAKRSEAIGVSANLFWPVASAVLIFIACFCAFQDTSTHGELPGCLCISLVGAVAVFGVFKRYWWGKFLLIGFVWLYFAPNEIKCLIAIQRDIEALQAYDAVSQLGIFSCGSYIVFHAISSFVLALLLSCLSIVAFPDTRDWAEDVHNSIRTARNRRGVVLGKSLAVICAAFLVALAIPGFLGGNMSGYLVTGTAEISNSYVEYLDAYHRDSALSEDDGWTLEFRSRSDELYNADGRFLNIDPSRIRRSDLRLYAQYSEASFGQMQAIEYAYECVRQRQPVDEAIRLFNESVDEQEQALASALKLVESASFLDGAANFVYDGLFFYMQFLGLAPLGFLFMGLGVICAALAVFAIIREKRATAVQSGGSADSIPLDDGESRDVGSWVDSNEGLNVGSNTESRDNGKWTADQRGQRKSAPKSLAPTFAVIAICVVAVLAEVIPAIEDQREASNNSEFTNAVLTTVSTRPIDLVLWLRDARSLDAADISADYLQSGINLIDAQLDGLRSLENWEELPDGADELGAALSSFIDEERSLLEEMRANLEGNHVPSFELTSQYTRLHYGENSKRIVEEFRLYALRYSVTSAVNLI